MSYSAKQKRSARLRRHLRVRKKVRGEATRPRLAVFRSNRHISAQVIDDRSGRTLASASTNESDLRAILDAAAEAGITFLDTADVYHRFPAIEGTAYLIGGFTAMNLSGFHAADGEGYRIVSEIILKLDAMNPQVRANNSTVADTHAAMPTPNPEIDGKPTRRVERKATP